METYVSLQFGPNNSALTVRWTGQTFGGGIDVEAIVRAPLAPPPALAELGFHI